MAGRPERPAGGPGARLARAPGLHRSVHQKDVDAIASYWQVLVFSGREVPPRIVKSDAEMLQFVRDTPGAVGYVSEDVPLAGVKPIAVRP